MSWRQVRGRIVAVVLGGGVWVLAHYPGLLIMFSK